MGWLVVLAQPVKKSTGKQITMLEGYALEVTLTTANAAAQAWYGYEQVSIPDFMSIGQG